MPGTLPGGLIEMELISAMAFVLTATLTHISFKKIFLKHLTDQILQLQLDFIGFGIGIGCKGDFKDQRCANWTKERSLLRREKCKEENAENLS